MENVSNNTRSHVTKVWISVFLYITIDFFEAMNDDCKSSRKSNVSKGFKGDDTNLEIIDSAPATLFCKTRSQLEHKDQPR